MTLEQFITKWNGKKCDFDGKYGGQCVDLVRQYIQDVLGLPQAHVGIVGAADFWEKFDQNPNLKNNFDKIPNTPTGIPPEGSIMIWKRLPANGNYGHISIVLGGATTSKFKSFDQNWRKLSVSEPTAHNYTNVYGWLHPKGK